MSYPTQNIIDTLGVSWKLDVQEFARLYYDHPVFGLLEYTGDVAWLCDNVNTLKLTNQGDLPDGVLPLKVCVRPSYDSAGCGCYDEGKCYDDQAIRCECADPCCDCMDEFLSVRCEGVTERCEGQACTGGRTGVESPSGPSYEFCCTLHGTEWCVVNYCSDGQWKRDIYCDENLVGTYDADHDKCPLLVHPVAFSAGPECGDCEGCVGEDCDPPGVNTCCCPDDEIPTTLTVEITDCGCASGTHSIVYDPLNDWWHLDLPDCGDPAFLRLSCSGDPCDWIYSIDYDGLTQVSGIATGSCSPFSISAPFSSALPNLPGCTGSITITV